MPPRPDDFYGIASGRIASAWSARQWGTALAGVLKELLHADDVALLHWDGPNPNEPVFFGATTSASRYLATQFVAKGLARRMRPYKLDRADSLSNRVMRFEDAVQGYSRTILKTVFRTALWPLGVEHMVRCPLYRGDKFIAYWGYSRRHGAPPFSDEEIANAQSLVPLLVDGIEARLALEREALSSGNVLELVDAIADPGFVVTAAGTVAYANRAARKAYAQTPGWIAPCDCTANARACPSWVRCVPLRLDGQDLRMLLPETLNLDPDHATEAPWAATWQLSPRHARVAALIMQGLPDKLIGDALGLSVSSARTYVRECLRRAGVNSRTELMRAALDIARPPR